MKQIVCLIYLILITSCYSQTKQQNKMNSNKELTLEELKKQGYLVKVKDTFIMQDNKLNIKTLKEKGTSVGSSDGYQKTTTYRIEKTLEDGTYIYIRGNELSGYLKKITKKGDLITTSYGYYPSGNLKQIGYMYPDFIKKGTWYWYNERGQINRLEEYDKPYNYTWEDILIFIQEKEIKKEDTYKILRWVDEKTKQPFWSIEVALRKDYNNNTILTQYYKLDGNTGNIVEEKEETYIYEER